MEYDETFVCPRCKQDYELSQFRPILQLIFKMNILKYVMR
jgi:hypothetical protein